MVKVGLTASICYIYFRYMTKTMLNVKTDATLKRTAQRIAKEMGVPLSIIVNAELKRFITERRVELFAIPTYRLKGKAAEGLDRLVEEGLREYSEGKTRAIKSLADIG